MGHYAIDIIAKWSLILKLINEKVLMNDSGIEVNEVRRLILYLHLPYNPL